MSTFRRYSHLPRLNVFRRYSHLPREAEIANLEHELGALREKHANFMRWRQQGKYLLIGGCVVGAPAIVLAFVYRLTVDPWGAVAVLVLLLGGGAFAGAITWAKSEWAKKDEGEALVRSVLRPIPYFPFFVPTFVVDHKLLLENGIEARERRLEELKADDDPHA